MIPRLGPPPRASATYRRRPGAYAILVRDGRILLTHQTAPRPEYQLPGGGVDPGESPLPALHREVMEETGWTVGGLRRLGAYRRCCFMPDYDLMAEKLCSVWLGRPILRRGPPREAGHSAHWMTPAQALVLLADPGGRRFLERAMAAGFL